MTTTTTTSSIGDQIRVARNLCGLSLAAVGERIGVSAQAVHAWETGGAFPGHENLLAVSALLGVQCGTTNQPEAAKVGAVPARPANLVLHELLLAELIINTLQNVLTDQQRQLVAAQLAAAGLQGSTPTRATERRAVITAAGAA